MGLVRLAGNERAGNVLSGLWGGSAAALRPCSCHLQTSALPVQQGQAAVLGGGASGSGGGARAGACFELDVRLPDLLAAAAAASPGPSPVTDLHLRVTQPGPAEAAGGAAGRAHQPPAATGPAATELRLDLEAFPLLERIFLHGGPVGPAQEPRVGA